MSLKKFGGALALVLGLAVSACGSDGDGGGGSGKACAWIEEGETLSCTDFVGKDYTKSIVSDFCDEDEGDKLVAQCSRKESPGHCKLFAGTGNEVHEYYYGIDADDADYVAGFCAEVGGVWVKH